MVLLGVAHALIASCHSDVVVGPTGGGGIRTASVGSGSGSGGATLSSVYVASAQTVVGAGGSCAPVPKDYPKLAIMIASCCNDQPCWGHCLDTPNGKQCDCYGIHGGCPLDVGLVCCALGDDCRSPDLCPPSK